MAKVDLIKSDHPFYGYVPPDCFSIAFTTPSVNKSADLLSYKQNALFDEQRVRSAGRPKFFTKKMRY